MSQRPAIVGHHLIWTLYGHWLANDLRGSGSEQLHEEKFAPLGPVHHGRKPEPLQPSRGELREFYKQAESLLKYQKFWLDAAKRQALGDAVEQVVARQGYTVWTCAILSNHMRMVIRLHRDDALTMWHQIADTTRLLLREEASFAMEHPVWSTRPYKDFLRTPEEVWTRVRYVGQNPVKEGLSPQRYALVHTYNYWPFHKPR